MPSRLSVRNAVRRWKIRNALLHRRYFDVFSDELAVVARQILERNMRETLLHKR
jgi:hypothetical protein